MNRGNQACGFVTTIGLVVFVLTLIKSDGYQPRQSDSTAQNTGINVKKGENQVWAVLPSLIPIITGTKHITDLVPLAQKRRSKFPRDSGRLHRLIRRQYHRISTTPTTLYQRSAFTRNGVLFPARSVNTQIFCPAGCVCFTVEVECKFAQLNDIPRGLSPHTEKLSIVGSTITNLSSAGLQDLGNLKSLIFVNNQLRTIHPETFANLPRLRRLRLSQNQLSNLPVNLFRGLGQLQRLDLRENKLTCLPPDIFKGLRDLRHINLSGNNIPWLSGDTFQDQTQLKHVDLTGNPFLCDCHIRPLIGYFLSTNQLPLLARSGAKCQSHQGDVGTSGQPINIHLLHQLHCPAGEQSTSPAICAKKSTISCISICDCTADHAANCQGRGLEAIPQDLPADLMEINLSHNKLKSLPKNAFERYRKLRKIVLDNNQISHVDRNAFSNLQELSSLYMSSNQLQALPPGLFAGLNNLKILYLHRNKISCLQKGSFEGLENLQILHLSDNRIQTFPRGSFTDLRRLKYLYLVHNPLICDCRMAWLPAFLIEKEAGGTQWARCAEPLEVQGQHVRDLLPTLMPCDDKLLNGQTDEPNCDITEDKCPDKCQCTEITVSPMVHARSDYPFQLHELGLISDGLSVDCSSLELDDLPETLPVNTKELNLRSNRIRKLKTDSALRNLPHLQSLLLEGNRIEQIDRLAFQFNRQLKKLILSNNSLTTFDHRILTGLDQLQVLLLQHNELTCLNNLTFSETPALKILMLNNNKIRCITRGAFDTMHLESLSLSANPLNCDCHLSWLPDWLRDHVNQVIAGPLPPTCIEPEQLAGTPVASLARYHFTCNTKPDVNCFHGVQTTNSASIGTSLATACSEPVAVCCPEPIATDPPVGCPTGCTCDADGVYCSDLGLTEIPRGIPESTTQLYLGRNKINQLDPNRIGYLSKLHTLVLSYNKLRELPENGFASLTNLKTLVLSHNEIQCIHPNAFTGLNGLRVLILQANNISSIPYGTFNGLIQLNNIALGQNPLHCDCNGKWLNGFFRQQFLDNGIALCHSPESMRFKSLYHSKPGDFVCPWIRRTGGNHNGTATDMSDALLMDETTGESSTNAPESGWWTDKSVTSKDIARMSSEERESLAIAAKCLPCMLNPCLNGGQCAAHNQLEFQCTCVNPYRGKRCELEVDACTENPCQNGGQCELTSFPNGFRCKCVKGFQGSRCEQSVRICSHNYCQNGGTCELVNNEHRCHCAPGFHGPHCQYAFTYCKDLNPCLNGGKCLPLPANKYRCECANGWTGQTCQTNVDDCLYNRCENGASCVDGINEYICKCRPGYAGIYCERPTWNPDSYVTRMDRRLPVRHRLQGFSSSEVRHSPIKIRSLSTPPMETLCAYHQCQNKATCIENQGDVYQCVCNPGFTGQYCEHLFSISLPSQHSYVAIVPPSRGALVPSGTISVKVSTHSASGILVYYADLVKTGKDELPDQYLVVDLNEGYVRVIFSLAKDLWVRQRSSTAKINDGRVHTVQLDIEGNNLTLTIDNLVQGSAHRSSSIMFSLSEATNGMNNETISRHLALTNPIYIGGAPADRLEAAGRILQTNPIVGMTGCIQDVHINGRPIDFGRLFGAPVDKMTGAEENHSERPSAEAKQHGTAIGILPGCYTKPNTLSETEEDHLSVKKSFSPQRIAHESQSAVCANPNICLNGGACVPLGPDATHYKCDCPAEFTGLHCEQDRTCHRSTQRSFIRDPQTNCISTRKLIVRTCAGTCDLSPTTPTTRSLWLPGSMGSHRRPESVANVCCQPVKVRHRRVHFQCANGSSYERTVKIIKRCACIKCTR